MSGQGEGEGEGEGAGGEQLPPVPKGKVLNVNIGLLGHVDSGKTSLARALSTISSTAAFDKNPQSQKRGITLDLGFSAFRHPLPPHLLGGRFGELQFTLVDCPGHASLIKTIIGGVHIINTMLLVVDVTKGIQTQTAECIVIGELMTDKMVVVLNKVDMLPEKSRDDKVKKMKERLAKVLKSTRFADAPMVAVSAQPGAKEDSKPEGVREVINQLLPLVEAPAQVDHSPKDFYFAIDHCFPIRGQGTVITGTVLSGAVEVNQVIEFPDLKLERKVKSIQMFRRSVNRIEKGDRAGICITQLDSKAVERGIAAAPGSVPSFAAAIVAVEKIRYHKQPVVGRHKIHVTVGHTTVMATMSFFRDPSISEPIDIVGKAREFAWDREYEHMEELQGSDTHPRGSQLALLEFDSPITAPLTSLLIGARLDTDFNASSGCRLAFYGSVLTVVDVDAQRKLLRVYKRKSKVAKVDRVTDELNVIGKNLVTKGKDISAFVGLTVRTEQGVEGKIVDSFGKSGKFKAMFRDNHGLKANDSLLLDFKKYVFDHSKALRQ